MRACTMPTASLRACKHPARYLYILDASHTLPRQRNGRIVAAYCAQHYRAGGHSAMLRPRPWDYSRVWDAVGKVNVA